MSNRLAHRVGRSSQATPAAVDKSLSASHTKNLTPPKVKKCLTIAFSDWDSVHA
jgi:hypothetical protein